MLVGTLRLSIEATRTEKLSQNVSLSLACEHITDQYHTSPWYQGHVEYLSFQSPSFQLGLI